jgi:hypothetical protein
MPRRHTADLAFTIPSDDWKVSEAKAWADQRALDWAAARKTVIVGKVAWEIDEMSIVGTAALSTEPRKPTISRAPAPHEGCAFCEQVAAFGDEATNLDIAAALKLSTSTVRRHRVIKEQKP